jgi:hypothetical protein
MYRIQILCIVLTLLMELLLDERLGSFYLARAIIKAKVYQTRDALLGQSNLHFA